MTKAQYQKQTGLKIGDSVKYTEFVINRAKSRYLNPSAEEREIFGDAILRSSYESVIKTYKVLDFVNLNGSWSIKIDRPSHVPFSYENEFTIVKA